MYKSIELINTEKHKHHNIKEIKDYGFAKELISTPITVPEFYECCKDYPIVFVKDDNNGWTASVMLGYKEKTNCFVDSEGTWEKNRYIPASIRRYPFIFVAQENDQLSLGIESSALSLDEADSERRIFDDNSVTTPFINGVLEFMNRFQGDAVATASFIGQLDKWELLEERTAQIVTSEQKNYQLNGFYVINEEKLRHLSKKKKQEICDQNAYPLITAHLISLSNFQRMGMR